MTEILLWSGWDDATAVASLVGLGLCLWFVVRYQALTGGAWRRSGEGRFFMVRKALLSGLFLAYLGQYLAPGWPGWQAVTFVLLATYAAHTYVPYRLLVHAQRDDREPAGRQ